MAALQGIATTLAGLRWSPHDALRVDVGGRFDLVMVQVRDALGPDGGGVLPVGSPRLTAAWKARPKLELFAAYGRGLRPPEARAFTTFDGGREGLSEEVQDTRPAVTVSDAFELGSRVGDEEIATFAASAFATFIARESLFDHVSGTSLELSGTRRVGLELVATGHPTSWLELEADATGVDARFVQSGNRVPLAPWLMGGVRSTLVHDNGVRAGLRLLGVAPRTLPHGAVGATLLGLDATAGYHRERWRLDLELENLLFRKLREGEYHYASNWRRGEPASQVPVLHTTAGAPANARLTFTALF